jgi:hypothetical protein
MVERAKFYLKRGVNRMWQVVYIASNKRKAESMRDKLTEEGFLVKVQPLGSEENEVFQILVPEGEAVEVAEYLSQAY